MSGLAERHQGEWHTFNQGISRTRLHSMRALLWDHLVRNASLPGGAKWVLAPGHSSPSLAAEIPDREGIDVPARTRAARAGIRAARLGFIRESGAPRSPVAAEAGFPVAPPKAPDLASLCAEAGWSAAERATGELAVDLCLSGDYQTASIAVEASGGIRVSVLFDVPVALPSLQREAVALALLRTSGVVRMARAAADAEGPGEGAGAPRLEVGLPLDATAEELDASLCALSVGAGLSTREVRVLSHSKLVASAYLATRRE